MITAEFFDSGEEFTGFKVQGHADYAEKGEDIVCAAVTSAVQITANTITEIFEVDCEIAANNGIVELGIIDSEKTSRYIVSQLIVGLLAHFELLQEDFPENIDIKIYKV